MTQKTEKIKLLQKPAKGKLGGLFIVFLWISLWNIVYQALHGIWAESEIQIVNWAFFAAVTLFFMQEELTYKQRFWHTLIGGTVGLLLAAGVVLCCTALMETGLSHTVAVSIPLIVCIAILILAHPYVPMVFNNVGFIYFIVAFVEKEHTVLMLPSYVLSLLAGSVILNLGCAFLIGRYTKALAKKAASN